MRLYTPFVRLCDTHHAVMVAINTTRGKSCEVHIRIVRSGPIDHLDPKSLPFHECVLPHAAAVELANLHMGEGSPCVLQLRGEKFSRGCTIFNLLRDERQPAARMILHESAIAATMLKDWGGIR